MVLTGLFITEYLILQNYSEQNHKREAIPGICHSGNSTIYNCGYLHHVVFHLKKSWGLSLYFLSVIKMQSLIVCGTNSLRIYK